jgi:hypothetical protein
MLNKILNKMQARLSDSDLKTRLFNKIRGPLFQHVRATINENPRSTFDSACTSIQNVITLELSTQSHDALLTSMMQSSSSTSTISQLGFTGNTFRSDTPVMNRRHPLAFQYSSPGSNHSYAASVSALNVPMQSGSGSTSVF